MDPDTVKAPATDVTFHPLLFHRWSPRAFSAKETEPEKLRRIYEAVRWAPSASNHQPWYFLVGFKGDKVYEKIFSTLVEFNQLWVSTAPVLMLAITKRMNPRGEVNRYRDYDLGQAVAYLTFQATAEGMYVHQMGGFDAVKAAQLLEIPEDFEVRTSLTLGYRGDPEVLHPNLKKLEYSERTRRPVGETVFTGSFGSKASFL